MSFEAKVIADSISNGQRLTTLQLRYPRFIHAELMTHRVFSRNASSSRAIPVAKMIEQVRTNPAAPIHWGKNQPGMQAFEEALDARVFLDLPMEYDNPSDVPLFTFERTELTGLEAWRHAANTAAGIAEAMAVAGYHKQVVNRILEPFQWISVIVTATEWDNFFELRDHEDAQPEIRHLARLMKVAMDASTPKLLWPGEWHLPYVSDEDLVDIRAHLLGAPTSEVIKLGKDVSAARCCRVSYLKHDGTQATIQEELALCERLVGARPLHASPFEHQATPDAFLKEAKFGGFDGWKNQHLHGNFKGWIQNRKLIELSSWSAT